MIDKPNIIPSGDSILIIRSLKKITSDKLNSILDRINSANISEVEDVLILKDHIGIFYNPYKSTFKELKSKIISLLSDDSIKIKSNKKRNWKIPICYNPELALDIKNVSEILKIDTKEFIEKHKKSSYIVDMIGFLPGFLYLGGLDNFLSLPRKKVPRKIIPKGSIGIAEKQTGIYNIESPGGWNIIGRTPLELFDKNSEPPIKIRQGDSITFYEVDINEFNRITNL
tara:strand:- start:2363 stop:3043 length:681 start_codon:yes stop_codon:yes gene_type:complete